ncbi:MAG: DNA adenine methylase [Candidatus Hydrogenedentes bacterium]|jgi:DNA adenine methylase|nr:DNA adenine methylase [Candidatus Hydrogenedentota bacterium]
MADTPRPILKWASGKRQLLDVINAHLPSELKEGKITRYHEPMVGGGAVFFHIKEKYGSMIDEYHISDYNWDSVSRGGGVADIVEAQVDPLPRLSYDGPSHCLNSVQGAVEE